MNSSYLRVLGLAALMATSGAAASGWETSGYTGLGYIDEGNLDDDSFASNLSVVYRFTDTLGVEGGYATFGEFENKFNTIEGRASIEADIDGFNLGLNFMTDLSDKWVVTGRIGLWMWDGDTTLKIPGSATLKGEDDGTDLYAGAGFGYWVTPRFYAGLGVTYFNVDVDGSDTGIVLAGLKTGVRF
jgi:hypothetical protein